MNSKYAHYSKEELVRIIEERDRRPKFGLVWERDEIDHDHSLNRDFVALDLVSELPESVCWPLGCAAARLASYQVFPPDLNNDEKAFAQLLDGDLGGTVVWWHRNEPRKPWSIGLVLPDGRHYYPDFAIKVKKRTKGDGILLVEVKGEHLINSQSSQDKAIASHKLYRAPLLVTKESSGRWMTLRFNDKTGKNEPDAVFRLDALAHY